MAGRKVSVAIAGVTGAVGQELLRCLEKRKFPLKSVRRLRLFLCLKKCTSLTNPSIKTD